MIRLNNLPDGLLKSTIADSALNLTCLIHEALRREMRVEISVDVKMKVNDGVGDWDGIKISIQDKEMFRG